jgi:hypothetical protein
MSTDLEQVIHRDDEMYDLDAETKPSKGKQLEQMINEPAEQKPDVELAPGDFGHQEPGAEG